MNVRTSVPSFDTKATYTLFHGDVELGTVSNLYGDQPEVGGDFTPSEVAKSYRPFFDHLTDDEREWPEPSDGYPETIFDDTLWFVEHPTDGRIPIWLPAIHWADGDISWRWR